MYILDWSVPGIKTKFYDYFSTGTKWPKIEVKIKSLFGTENYLYLLKRMPGRLFKPAEYLEHPPGTISTKNHEHLRKSYPHRRQSLTNCFTKPQLYHPISVQNRLKEDNWLMCHTATPMSYRITSNWGNQPPHKSLLCCNLYIGYSFIYIYACGSYVEGLLYETNKYFHVRLFKTDPPPSASTTTGAQPSIGNGIW